MTFAIVYSPSKDEILKSSIAKESTLDDIYNGDDINIAEHLWAQRFFIGSYKKYDRLIKESKYNQQILFDYQKELIELVNNYTTLTPKEFLQRHEFEVVKI